MVLDADTAAELGRRGIPFKEQVPLAKRTYWRVGGPADGWISASEVATVQAVREVCARTGCPVFVLGNASNLLIADAGIRGLVVQLTGALAGSSADTSDPPVVTLGAGLKLVVAMKRAEKHGWTGLECFAGIPGTVGGAIRMNAGSRLGETRDALLDVDVVLADGTRARIAREELKMGYRSCELPDDAIVVTARFQTTGTDPEQSRARVKTFLERRKATQPLNLPSCGSTFRNPEGDYAGRLIEAAGLKGHQIGGARVSEKHANFFVNTGSATAADLRALIEHARSEVEARFGVRLVREVHYAGDWEAV